MKQIIPFKKELLFKTKISEITSISLEHTLTLKEDDLISGEFYVSGDYKMTEGSINREKFEFKLPFDIALDSRYEVASIVIDIDNFYYEIVNNESLQVNIDVYVEGKRIEEPQLEEINFSGQEISKDEDKMEVVTMPLVQEESLFRDSLMSVESEKTERKVPMVEIEELEKTVERPSVSNVILEQEHEKQLSDEFNLFENMDNSDTYVTYYVYVVKEDDTLEKILTKYQVTKEKLELYNNNLDIKPGTKLVIPSNCNE